jgi:DnaK suppressor protein
MAKTRGAAEKKPAKKAAKKAAPAKSSARATAAKSASKAANGKASSKPSAAKPAAKTAKVAKAASKPPARKASAAPEPKPTKAAKAPAPERAKAAPEPAAPVAKKPKASPEREPAPAAPAPLPEARGERPAAEQLDDAARARALSEGVRAHPDAQLTQDEIALLYEKLVAERERVLAGHDRHLSEALADSTVMPDETDMAQRSTEQAYLIRFADKERKLLTEIEHALDKMRGGEYGLCEGTDEPIGFKRLELRPWTRYSVGYKEQMERERSQHRRG